MAAGAASLLLLPPLLLPLDAFLLELSFLEEEDGLLDSKHPGRRTGGSARGRATVGGGGGRTWCNPQVWPCESSRTAPDGGTTLAHMHCTEWQGAVACDALECAVGRLMVQ